jgi:hypothetical protein
MIAIVIGRIGLGLAVALLGCGMHQGSGTLIGATCGSSAECGPGGVCVTSGKDGQCAMSCSVPGGVAQCPLGSNCDNGNWKTDTTGKSSMTLCLPACTDSSECRSGYACNAVSGGPGRVCVPK